MDKHSLQIQSILYHNEKKSLLRAMESLSNAIELNKRTTKELQDVILYYGDASKEPLFTEEETADVKAQFAKSFLFKYKFFNDNTGSAKGHNILGADCNSKYMLIMNPDVIVCPRFFTKMLSPFLNSALNAGIIEARQTPVEHPKEYNKKTFETGWATTACAMFTTDTFRTIDGFDADTFFMYCDDLDFSWRVRLLGKKIYYRPDCIVFHSKTLSAKGGWKPTNAEVYYSAQAGILMAYKWSADEKFNMLYKMFSNSPDQNLKRAAVHFDEMKKSGKLPKKLDPDHTVAEFVGDNYTKHRFAL